MPKRYVFVSYSTRSEASAEAHADAEVALTLLVAGLEAAGYGVLIDRKNLRTGEHWRYAIYRWLALCDAAIVLFSPSALKSKWVRKEAELLMWRRALEGGKSPMILPYRLGGVTVDDLPAGEFSATYITELQSPASLPADLVVDALARLATLGTTAVRTPQRAVELAVASSLKKLEVEQMEAALATLGADPDPFDPGYGDEGARLRHALAARLLASELPVLKTILEDIAPSLEGCAAEALVSWVASFRVDASAAGTVVLRASADKRELAIPWRRGDIARLFVRRGYLRPAPPRVAEVLPDAGAAALADDSGRADAVVRKVLDALAQNGRSYDDARLKAHLRGSNEPHFVCLPMSGDDPALRARLRAEFPTVTFLFLTRCAEQATPAQLADIDTLEVETDLEDRLDQEIFDARAVIGGRQSMSKAIEFKPKRTEHFEKEGSRYVYSESVALAVRVALAAGRPLLVRGAPGSGKSTLAKNVALTLGFRYREAVVTSRTQARDLLYRFDSLRRLQDAHANALKPDGEYVRPAVFWWAFDASSANERTPPAAQEPAPDKPCVVLIDEIDKADPDVPNDLLIPLGENRFEVEETGKVVRAVTPPFVVLTTNDERSLPPAFLRRCVVLNLERPDLVEVARLHLGDGKNDVALYKTVAAQQQEIEARMRERGLRAPSTAEYLDTVRACQQLGVDRLADIAALTLEKERADDVP